MAVRRIQISGRERLILAGILLAALVVYLRCLGNGFVWDDEPLILSNPYIGQWWSWFNHGYRTVGANRYRPLFSIWLALSYHLFGFNPAGWHALTVAVHLIAVWLVFKVGLALTGRRESALLAAALFALLPIHAQAVVWPAASCEVLAGTLALASFYFFIRRGHGRRRNWPLALALYAGALVSHEGAIAFPGLVAWYVFLLEPGTEADSTPTPPGVRVSRALVCMAPFALEMLLYLSARRYELGFTFSDPANPANPAPISQIIMTVPHAFGAYLMLLAVPWMAGPAHKLEIVTSLTSPGFYLPVVALIALAAGLPAAVWRSPRRRLYLFCAGWIPIALSPMMDLHALPRDLLVNDNYLYLASVGSCLLLSDWATRLADRGAMARRLAWAAASVLLLSYAGTLWNVQRYYHDDAALFARCVADFPESQICHSQLGAALVRSGDLAGAERELRAAQILDPLDPRTLYQLGQVDALLGRLDQGTKEVARGLSMLPNASAYHYMVLAQLYYLNGEPAQSEAVLSHTETLPEGAHAAGLARAQIAITGGDSAGAETLLRGLTSRYPDDERPWVMLGQVLAQQRRNDQALSAYDEAVKLTPGDPAPRLAAARLLHAMNRDREALDECRLALAASPSYRSALALMTEIERGAGPH